METTTTKEELFSTITDYTFEVQREKGFWLNERDANVNFDEIDKSIYAIIEGLEIKDFEIEGIEISEDEDGDTIFVISEDINKILEREDKDFVFDEVYEAIKKEFVFSNFEVKNEEEIDSIIAFVEEKNESKELIRIESYENSPFIDYFVFVPGNKEYAILDNNTNYNKPEILSFKEVVNIALSKSDISKEEIKEIAA